MKTICTFSLALLLIAGCGGSSSSTSSTKTGRIVIKKPAETVQTTTPQTIKETKPAKADKKISSNRKSKNPVITLIDPKDAEIQKITVGEKSITVRIKAESAAGISEVLINNNRASRLGQSEYFVNLILSEGDNNIEVMASDKDGLASELTFSVRHIADTEGPVIKITEPLVSRGIKIVRKSDVVKVKGIAEDESGVYEVTINNVRTKLKSDGSFSASMNLSVGENILIVRAVDNKLNASADTFVVNRKLEEVISAGRFIALVIGINSYTGHWPELNCAVKDAEAIGETLRDFYGFSQVEMLLDKKATRKNIIQKMECLTENARPEDNVIIFYAGHGQFNKNLNKGYWVPVDAASNSVADYISNNDIKTFVGGIQAKHTLLITDACFAGDIFRGRKTDGPSFDPNNAERYYKEVYRKQSRLALTSGGVEEVMDAWKEGHSVFTYYLLKSLHDNQNKYFDASQLYNEFKVAVTNNSEQTPMLQAVRDTNDEGGQFVFIRSDK